MKIRCNKATRIFLALTLVVAAFGFGSNAVSVFAFAPPKITGFNWTPAPKSNQPFGGSISGTDFVVGTRLIFCVVGTSTCRTHPAANVTFASSSRLNISNVKLAAGRWQFYVQTPEGPSAKSNVFNVVSQ
ncbi:MAG: hypothetical protein WBO10_17295 [Pyrinomonadaceae bacterium]